MVSIHHENELIPVNALTLELIDAIVPAAELMSSNTSFVLKMEVEDVNEAFARVTGNINKLTYKAHRILRIDRTDIQSMASRPNLIELKFNYDRFRSRDELKVVAWRMANAAEWLAQSKIGSLTTRSLFKTGTWNQISLHIDVTTLAHVEPAVQDTSISVTVPSSVNEDDENDNDGE